MSAPLLWVLLPLVVAAVLLLAGTTRRAGRWGAGVALALALLAWKVPIDQPVRLIGDWGFRLAPTMRVLGRQLVLTDASRPMLAWLFAILALWLAVAATARMEPAYVGLAMAFVTTLVAALTIRPFLYAALLIETAALIAVPLLAPPGTRAGRGLLRFLTFQTLGMLFILFTGWMLAGTETGLPSSTLALRGGVLLGIGFVLLLGVFPFHSWMPMMTEEIHPYAAALVLTSVITVVGAFGLGFLEQYTWLRESPATYHWLQMMGAVMVGVGGVLAAFQRDAGRVLGYAVLMDAGLALMALGMGLPDGAVVFFALWPVRAVAFVLWALALSGLGRRRGGLAYKTLQGAGRTYPWLMTGAVLAPLVLAGMPWFGGFLTRLKIWESVIPSWPLLAAAVSGAAGLVAAAFRLLGVLLAGEQATSWRAKEMMDEKIWVTVLLLALLLLGLFPQWWWHYAAAALQRFPHLGG